MLRHNARTETRDLKSVVNEFLTDPGADEVYFAVSRDFSSDRDLDHYEEIYAGYESFFEELSAKLIAILGAQAFSGSWEDSGFPDWAVGERIVTWEAPEQVYLRLHHEDPETPILVALSRFDRESDDADDDADVEGD